MGLSSGHRSDLGEEKVVVGCYNPNNPNLPSQTLYAHFLVLAGQADQLLGYTLDGIRPAVFTIDLNTLVPGGGTWTPGSCDGDFTDVACLEYYIPASRSGYVTQDFGADPLGNVLWQAVQIPSLDQPTNAVGQDYDTGLVYFAQTIPMQMTVFDPSIPNIVATTPISGGLPFPNFWRSVAFDPSTGEMWFFGTLGTGFSTEAYTVDKLTGQLTLRWVSSNLTTFGGTGAAFKDDGRLYMGGDDLGDVIIERDPLTGVILDTIPLTAGFWADHNGMSFDEVGDLHIANNSTSQIEVYFIDQGTSPTSLIFTGTFGGPVSDWNFTLLRSLAVGPVKFRRYFHKDFDTDLVTFQDHEYVSGDPLVFPDSPNIVIDVCGDIGLPAPRRTRFQTTVIDIPVSTTVEISSIPGMVSWTIRNRESTGGSNLLTVNGVGFLMDGDEVMSSGGVNEEGSILYDSIQIVTGAIGGVRMVVLRRL